MLDYKTGVFMPKALIIIILANLLSFFKVILILTRPSGPSRQQSSQSEDDRSLVLLNNLKNKNKKGVTVYSGYKDRKMGQFYRIFKKSSSTKVAFYCIKHSGYKDTPLIRTVFCLSLYPEYTVFIYIFCLG